MNAMELFSTLHSRQVFELLVYQGSENHLETGLFVFQPPVAACSLRKLHCNVTVFLCLIKHRAVQTYRETYRSDANFTTRVTLWTGSLAVLTFLVTKFVVLMSRIEQH